MMIWAAPTLSVGVVLRVYYIGRNGWVPLQINFQPDRTVVTAHYFGQNGSAVDAVLQSLGDQKVVDTPACVLFA